MLSHLIMSLTALAAADCSQKCCLIPRKGNNALLSEFSSPQMPVIRSAAAKCPQPLVPVNGRSVRQRVNSSADVIGAEAAGPGLMSPLQLSPLLQVPQYSTKTSPAERQWQQQSVSYLLSLPLIPSLAAVPGICPWNVDLGSVLPTHRASLLLFFFFIL